jgi:hypothetical protein
VRELRRGRACIEEGAGDAGCCWAWFCSGGEFSSILLPFGRFDKSAPGPGSRSRCQILELPQSRRKVGLVVVEGVQIDFVVTEKIQGRNHTPTIRLGQTKRLPRRHNRERSQSVGEVTHPCCDGATEDALALNVQESDLVGLIADDIEHDVYCALAKELL